MKTKRILSVVLALVMLITVFTAFDLTAFAAEETVTVNAAGTYYQSDVRKALSWVNTFRTGPDAWYWASDNTTKITVSGLQPLTYDYGLEQIAMQRAAEIAASFSHTRPNGQSCFTATDSAGHSSYGENIAAGYASGESVIKGWREDDKDYDGQGHRRNMLNRNFTAIGMAGFQYNGIYYWVQEFGYSVYNTTKTTAVDTQKNVPIEIAKSYLSNPSISLSFTSVNVQASASAALPVCTLTVNVYGGWPSATHVFTVTPAYSFSPTGVATVSGVYVIGKAVGSTTATASFLGASAKLYVTVTCNHTFKVTTVKEATHYERGLAHKVCTKCGYTVDEETPRLSYYSDVKDTQWFFDAVDYCTEKGYTNGYGNGKFGPADKLQRQDFVLMLARIAGADLSAYSNGTGGLSDIAVGKYYSPAVAWAVEKGIITGYNNGKFGVGDPITREQVATILYRYLGSPEVDATEEVFAPFKDRSRISAFASDAMIWAIKNMIIKGKDATTLAPTATASRADISTIIMRMDKADMFKQ